MNLVLGASVYDPEDPVGKMFFNVLATFAEFEDDLIRLRTREVMAIARAKGKLRGSNPSCPRNSRKSCAGCMNHQNLLPGIGPCCWFNGPSNPRWICTGIAR